MEDIKSNYIFIRTTVINVKWIRHKNYNLRESIYNPFDFNGVMENFDNFINNFVVFKFEKIDKVKHKLVQFYLLIQISDINNIILNHDLYYSGKIYVGVDVDGGDTIVSADGKNVKILNKSFDIDDPSDMNEFMFEQIKYEKIDKDFIFAYYEEEIDPMNLTIISTHYANILNRINEKEQKIAELQAEIDEITEYNGDVNKIREVLKNYNEYFEAQLQEQHAKKKQKEILTLINTYF